MRPAHTVSPFALVLLLGFPAAGQEQRYDVIRAMFPPQSLSTTTVFVFDLDGNGSPDAYLAGQGQDRLYRNDGTGVFADETWRLPVESDSAGDAATADFDGDGSLDIVVGTLTEGDRLYRNRGGTFVDASGSLPGDPSQTYAVVCGDLDGDGDADLLLGDRDAPDRLYLNDGLGAFVDATAQIPAGSENTTDLVLGDVDADGDLDAAIAVGIVCWAPTLQDRLYLNDDAAGFKDATEQLPADQERTTSVVLGDVDGDADLDLLMGISTSCSSGAGSQDRLYRNDGAGTFADATDQLPSFLGDTHDCALGDVDGDGDLDALFGDTEVFMQPGSGANRLCLNDGAGAFCAAPFVPLVESTNSVALADVDGDRDLDVLVGNQGTPRLHLNDGEGAFAPVEVAVPSDAKRAIGMGDVDADGDLDALFITPLPSTMSYVPLEADQRLFLGDGAGYFAESPEELPTKRPAVDAAFGDVDADGDPDAMLACPYDGEYYPITQDNLLYLNDGAGGFTDATDQLPTYVGDDRGVPRSVRLVDVDGDADLDALFAETEDYDGGTQGVALFLNDGRGFFSEASDQVSYFGYGGAPHLEPGDVDGDGDVDLVAGSDPGWLYLMLNDGAAHFADATAQMPPLAAVGITTHLSLGDVDGDRDLDVVFGFLEWSSYETRNLLYLNDGAGFFADASERIPQVLDDYLMADVDEDGDLDLLGGESLLWNDGTGIFEAAAAQVPSGLQGPKELGDVDGDGDLDALVAPGTAGLPTPTGQDVVWSNLTRHLAWRGLPRVGKVLTMDVYGTPAAPWLLAVSPAAAQLELPPFGTLQLDRGLLALVGSGALGADGRAALRFEVPPDPLLASLSLHWQALVGWPLRFTNRELTLFSGL